MTGYDGFTTPCSSDAPDDGNGSATTTPYIVRRRACQDSFREHRGDSAQAEDIVCGFVARTGEERLPQRVMFGELVGGKGYSGGQEKDWLVNLKKDMSVFGMKFEGWRKAAQKAGRWFRRVEEGAELFMRKWHEAERHRAAERHAKAAAAPSTVGISKRPGEGGRGGRGGKRLKSGSGHHRLEICGPSNGRHKLA